mgnify:CR=1 FL=1
MLTYLTYSGTCCKHFHFKCVNVSDDLHNQLSTIPAGLTWKCTECANKCVCLDPESLNDFLSKKFDEMVSSVKHVFSDLKTELVTSAENQIKNTLPDAKLVESFSDILKNKTTPVILIEPKNYDHDSVQTKSDLTSHINHLDTSLQFEKLKSRKKCAMIVGCTSAEQNQRFKKLVEEKVGNAYVIREFKEISPRVCIVGFSQSYDENEWDELADLVKTTNSSIFGSQSECRVLKFWTTKKEKEVHQALLQIDKNSYDKLMIAGGIFVGYD